MDNLARKSGMRGMEREEAKADAADRGTDPGGNISQHVQKDEGGDHHFNLTTLVDHLEQQSSGPHDDRSKEFGKPNVDKFTAGASKDSAKDSKGNEYA